MAYGSYWYVAVGLVREPIEWCGILYWHCYNANYIPSYIHHEIWSSIYAH